MTATNIGKAAAMRAECHDAVAKNVATDADTRYDPEGHAITIGTGKASSMSVIVVDGAHVELDDRDVINICGRLLYGLAKKPDAPHRVKSSWELLAREALADSPEEIF